MAQLVWHLVALKFIRLNFLLHLVQLNPLNIELSHSSVHEANQKIGRAAQNVSILVFKTNKKCQNNQNREGISQFCYSREG